MNHDASFSALSARLDLSHKALEKLSYSQLEALKVLTSSSTSSTRGTSPAPIRFLRELASKSIDASSLLPAAVSRDVECPYRTLLSLLVSQTGVTLDAQTFPLKDQQLLLAALSRQPETQLVSVPLFLRLYRYVASTISTAAEARSTAPGASGEEEAKMESCASSAFSSMPAYELVSLEIPDLLYVFDLIHSRIGTSLIKTHPSPFLSLAAIKLVLSQHQINLSNAKFDLLVDILGKCNIVRNGDSVDVQQLLKLCSTCSNHHSSIDQSSSNGGGSSSRSSSSASRTRLLENVKHKWRRGIYPFLQNSTAISEIIFGDALRACNIIISTADRNYLWQSLCSSFEVENNSSTTTLSISQLNSFFTAAASVEQQQSSCISALMRDVPAARIRKEPSEHLICIQPSPKVLEALDWGKNCGQSGEVSTHAPPPIAIHIPSQNSLPWQSSEESTSTNISRHVQRRIDSLSDEHFGAFVDLLDGECIGIEGDVTRSALATALKGVGIRFSKIDSDALWADAARSCKDKQGGMLSITNFLSWISPMARERMLAHKAVKLQEQQQRKQIQQAEKEEVSFGRGSEVQMMDTKSVLNVNTTPPPPPSSLPSRSRFESTPPAPPSSSSSSSFLAPTPPPPPPSSSSSSLIPSFVLPFAAGGVVVPKEGEGKEKMKRPHVSSSITDFWALDGPTRYAPQPPRMRRSVAPIPSDKSMVELLSYDEGIEGVEEGGSKRGAPVEASVTHEEREDAIQLLNRHRAQLALIFRRLLEASPSNKNCVLCKAFAEELSSKFDGPFSSPTFCWIVACDMANVAVTTDLHSAYISYDQVLKYLDQESPAVAQKSALNRSLKKKLVDSTCVQGDRLRLLSQMPILRQRLKGHFNRHGRSSVEESVASCSIRDITNILLTIDLSLTENEARMVFNELSKEEEAHVQEASGKLGAFVLYLANLLL